jgi:hypothetical protein
MWFRWLVLALFTLSSGIIIVAAGHGVAPLWYIAMAGWGYWTLTALFASVGYLSLIIGLLTSPNTRVSYPYVTTAGAALIVASACAVFKADEPLATIVWAAPMVFFFLLYQIISWSGDGR